MVIAFLLDEPQHLLVAGSGRISVHGHANASTNSCVKVCRWRKPFKTLGDARQLGRG